MRLHLGGHLNWYEPQHRAWVELDLGQALPLAEVLAPWGIAPGEIMVVLVNGRVSSIDDLVGEDDTVEIYPPLGGG